MIIGIEGLSKHGKTTLINKYIERYPDTIRFRGAGAVNVGMMEDWQRYNFSMRNIIENLDRLNNYKKVILWDRFLTDAVYSEDRNYASEILRVMKSHKHKAVIYINPNPIIVKLRDCKEGSDYENHRKRYSNIVKSFKTLYIDLKKEDDYFITDEIIDEVHKFITDLINKI